LGRVPESPVLFERYDLASGLSYVYGFAIADFDCNGRHDVAFFDSFSGEREAMRLERGAIGFIQWNGGKLAQVAEADMYLDLNQPTKPAQLFERPSALDVNNDGRLDIVGAANASAAVLAYINPGSRTTLWPRRTLNSSLAGAVNVATSDMDGDGDIDVVAVMRESAITLGGERGVAWIENPGVGQSEWVRHQIGGAGLISDPRTLIVRDLNRDGRQDVIVSDASGGLTVFSRGGDGRWQGRSIADVSSIHGHFGRVVDFDRDGEIDVLQPVYLGISWVRNKGRGEMWDIIRVADISSESLIPVITEVDAGDIDLDGRVDIVFSVGSLAPDAVSPRFGGVYWLRQGSSGWEPFRVYADENAAVAVSLVDYDGDGDLDIVSNSEYQQNAVTLWLNKVRSSQRVW
jgi:hypothetical protein